MALFVLMCVDHPGGLERRLSVREQHLAYVREHIAMVKVAGPILDDAGEMAGSMFVIEAPDKAAVEAFSGCSSAARGRYIVNRVPFPIALSTSIVPPDW